MFGIQRMAPFNPILALLGGALIGLASVLLMMFIGRIAGISGILGGCLTLAVGDKVWRLTFILGLILSPVVSGLLGYPLPTPQFGARLGGGCTSGHGVCGIARISTRSIAATAIFMATAIVVVAIMRHGIGG
jgi:uncharacterized membrane protein YedE/YeeE